MAPSLIQKKRERFLASLKYPTMNGRRNQIMDPHAKTFEWIFTGPQMSDGDSTEDDDAKNDDAVDFSSDNEFSTRYGTSYIVKEASAQESPEQARVHWSSFWQTTQELGPALLPLGSGHKTSLSCRNLSGALARR